MNQKINLKLTNIIWYIKSTHISPQNVNQFWPLEFFFPRSTFIWNFVCEFEHPQTRKVLWCYVLLYENTDFYKVKVTTHPIVLFKLTGHSLVVVLLVISLSSISIYIVIYSGPFTLFWNDFLSELDNSLTSLSSSPFISPSLCR